MFEEEEPGKPKNWGCAIGTIAVVSLINLGIFVVLRVLLDSENEFDEPILQGELRENVTIFLGIFSLSFCFGCCCCFCCGGAIFKWIFSCSCSCLDISTLWESAIKRPTLIKKKATDDQSIEDMIMQKQEEHLQRKVTAALAAVGSRPSDHAPYEHTPIYNNEAFDEEPEYENSNHDSSGIHIATVHQSPQVRETLIDFSATRVAPSKGGRIRSQSFSEFTDIPV